MKCHIIILWCIGVWEGRFAPDKHTWYYKLEGWLAFEAFPQLSLWSGQASVRRRVEIPGFPRPPPVSIHVVLFWCFSLLSWGISADPSKTMGNFPEVFNFNRLLLKLTGCLHHGPWSRPKALSNLWLVVELVPGRLWFTPRQKCQSDHGLWGPQKTYFKACIIRWLAPMDFAVGEAKEVF